MGVEERAETIGVERRVNEGKAHRKKGMQYVPSTPSGNLYSAMIHQVAKL